MNIMEIDSQLAQIAISHKPMVRLLDRLEKHGEISTRMLLATFGGHDLHSQLLEAEKSGFIRRESQKPKGKGNHLMVQTLTPQGRQVLETARLLGLV